MGVGKRVGSSQFIAVFSGFHLLAFMSTVMMLRTQARAICNIPCSLSKDFLAPCSVPKVPAQIDVWDAGPADAANDFSSMVIVQKALQRCHQRYLWDACGNLPTNDFSSMAHRWTLA